MISYVFLLDIFRDLKIFWFFLENLQIFRTRFPELSDTTFKIIYVIL